MAQSEKTLTAVFTDTANAIRAKKQSVAEISPLDFADEVASIPTGVTPTGTIQITQNNIYNVTDYASAEVNVNTPQSVNVGFASLAIDDSAQTKAAWLESSYLNEDLDDFSLMDLDINWGDDVPDPSEPAELLTLPGTHRSLYEHPGDCFVVGVVGLQPSDTTWWDLDLHITYNEYNGSYTAEEIEQKWRNFFENTEVDVYDIEGHKVGKVNLDSISVTCRADS